MSQSLAQEEIDSCRDAFLAFDKDRSGTIDVWELRQVLEGKKSGEFGGGGSDVRPQRILPGHGGGAKETPVFLFPPF
jgi:Ca2+-binding EF-hand superfamily protein